MYQRESTHSIVSLYRVQMVLVAQTHGKYWCAYYLNPEHMQCCGGYTTNLNVVCYIVIFVMSMFYFEFQLYN